MKILNQPLYLKFHIVITICMATIVIYTSYYSFKDIIIDVDVDPRLEKTLVDKYKILENVKKIPVYKNISSYRISHQSKVFIEFADIFQNIQVNGSPKFIPDKGREFTISGKVSDISFFLFALMDTNEERHLSNDKVLYLPYKIQTFQLLSNNQATLTLLIYGK